MCSYLFNIYISNKCRDDEIVAGKMQKLVEFSTNLLFTNNLPRLVPSAKCQMLVAWGTL